MSLLAVLLQIPAAEAKSENVLHLLLSADPVVKFTLFILVVFSIVSWAIIFFKFLQVQKAQKSSNRFLEQFEESETLEEVLTKPSPREGNPLYAIFSAGISPIIRYRQAYAKDPQKTPKSSFDTLQRAVNRTAREEVTKLEQLTPF